jgi:hypothetical protein
MAKVGVVECCRNTMGGRTATTATTRDLSLGASDGWPICVEDVQVGLIVGDDGWGMHPTMDDVHRQFKVGPA